MHTYRMQQLIKLHGKDEVINVSQRNSLYQTITRLEREGLLEAKSVSRDRKRPERTIYELTSAGHAIMVEWTRQILSTPSNEFPEFPAAVSVLVVLTPKDALQQFEKRIAALETEISRLDALSNKGFPLPRLFLLEVEYLRAQTSNELRWVQAVANDIRSGSLTWSKTWLRKTLKDLKRAKPSL